MNNETPFESNTIRKILASGAIGNTLETYDLILISLMATTLSQTFFAPSSNPYMHVIDVIYIYLAGMKTGLPYSPGYLLIATIIISFIGQVFT